PNQLPPIYIAASGEKAATMAGEMGDGLVTTAPKGELVETFVQAGGKGKPRYAEITVCWAADEATARRTVHEIWPITGIRGELSQELPLPRHFEQAAQMVREEDVAETAPC